MIYYNNILIVSFSSHYGIVIFQFAYTTSQQTVQYQKKCARFNKKTLSLIDRTVKSIYLKSTTQ
jgi:hypothetical protein